MSRRGGSVRIGVVTDSTACLPDALVEAAGLLRVVPLNVTIADVTHTEDELSAGAVADAQEEGISVTTSRPSPARFVEIYRDLVEQGCTGIVSVHASERLSSTVSSARLAAIEAGVPVEVVDSRTLGMGLGFGALAAERWARAGHDLEAVAQAARSTCASSRTAFYVDSLEPLRRGGRIGRAGALFGSALSIKPLLQVSDGAIAPLARVRSRAKAVERLGAWSLAQADALAGGERVCAVHSLQHSALAQSLVTRLSDGDEREDREPVGEERVAPGGENGAGASGEAGGRGAERLDVVDAGAAAQGQKAGAVDTATDGDAVQAPRWAMEPVQARLGAVVTAHVGAGALGAVVAVMPPVPPVSS